MTIHTNTSLSAPPNFACIWNVGCVGPGAYTITFPVMTVYSTMADCQSDIICALSGGTGTTVGAQVQMGICDCPNGGCNYLYTLPNTSQMSSTYITVDNQIPVVGDKIYSPCVPVTTGQCTWEITVVGGLGVSMSNKQSSNDCSITTATTNYQCHTCPGTYNVGGSNPVGGPIIWGSGLVSSMDWLGNFQSEVIQPGTNPTGPTFYDTIPQTIINANQYSQVNDTDNDGLVNVTYCGGSGGGLYFGDLAYVQSNCGITAATNFACMGGVIPGNTTCVGPGNYSTGNANVMAIYSTMAACQADPSCGISGGTCNDVYYHLFSMCHSGLEPYNFQQGSVVVWEGSPNFISQDCTSTNLLVNNTDFYLSAGQPLVGQTIGVKDKVGLSCMVYVGLIPYPIVNPVKLTKLVSSINVYEDCSTCVNLAVKGCTELKANNYNRLATIDDGSCLYSNLPCKGCCVSESGKQYTPTQPCTCEYGYKLSSKPCNLFKYKPCETCCYSKTKGIYHPSNKSCFCEEGDISSPCNEDESNVLGECTNCCTNKSGKLFSPKRSDIYGCSCVSGSWLTPCKGETVISNIEIPPTKLVTTTLILDTCEEKIDSGFNETLSHLSISNHLDSIYKLSGGYTNSWSDYKFKHYPTSTPTKTDELCLAIDSWSDIQDAYWVYVKNVKVIYNPSGSHEKTISSNVTSFSELYGWSADTLPITLDNTKNIWEAMELWNNDTTVWTPGVFSMEYNLVYCDCSGSGSFGQETTVEHVFGGTEAVYVVKVDTLTNYKCISGTNPLVAEVQQTCAPTADAVGVGVYDNINSCINSGCAGYMTCGKGVSVDGVKFGGEKVYSPIVMCCEKLITTSKEKLTRDICQSQCGDGEIWYPLYNAFAPNLMFGSLLGYMTRDLLNKVNNYECKVSKDDNGFKASGLVEKTK